MKLCSIRINKQIEIFTSGLNTLKWINQHQCIKSLVNMFDSSNPVVDKTRNTIHNLKFNDK